MEKNKPTKRSAKYWLLRPISMLKACMNWKGMNDAPWWSMFGVIFDFSVIFFIIFLIIGTIRILHIKCNIYNALGIYFSAVKVSIFCSIVLMTSLIIVLAIYRGITGNGKK